MSSKRYPVMTSKNGTATRLGWHSPASGEMFCGICLQAKMGDAPGDRCPVCDASVSRSFEVVQGGRQGKFFREPLQVHPASGTPTELAAVN